MQAPGAPTAPAAPPVPAAPAAPEAEPVVNDTIEDILAETEELLEPEEEAKPVIIDTTADVVAFEGDLIDLKPYVMDPDDDVVTLGFTAPFDENGTWQTETGDAGFYSIIVSATDNKDSFVTRQLTVKVLVRNRAPVFGMSDMVEFSEGDLINLDPQITDPDGDEVVVTYSGWMNSRTYQTTFKDAGTYQVTINANDGVVKVSKDVTVVVNDVNTDPILKVLTGDSVEVTEGELVTIETEVSDPEGDTVTVTMSEPVGDDGKWQTMRGDAGTYAIEITASDSRREVTDEVLVEVLRQNSPPVIESFTVSPEEVVLKKPGDEVTITLKVAASDPDGDDITLEYSGYMDSDTKTVVYGNKGGMKSVKVTASDGRGGTASAEVSFSMNNWPCFDCA